MEDMEKLVQELTTRILDKIQAEEVLPRACVRGTDELREKVVQAGFHLVEDSHEADDLLIQDLSLASLLRLSQLVPQPGLEEEIFYRMLAGKSVFVVDWFQELESSMSIPRILAQKIKEAQRLLVSYGLRGGSLNHYLSQSSPQVQDSPANSSKKQLITEKKLRDMNLQDGAIFKLEPGTIVTALARDFLKRHHILLEE